MRVPPKNKPGFGPGIPPPQGEKHTGTHEKRDLLPKNDAPPPRETPTVSSPTTETEEAGAAGSGTATDLYDTPPGPVSSEGGTNEARVAGAAVGTAIAAGAAGAITVAATPPLPSSYFDHLNIRDKPINEIPILVSHNAGTEPGSIPLFATNQSMSIGEVLDKTPVRGFAIDLHYRDGVPVLNHGGVFDPTRESPPLSSAIDPIVDFINQPGNEDEVVFIMVESYLGSKGTSAALREMKAAFGNKLFTPHDWNQITQNTGATPTLDEMTANGPRVVLISNEGDNYASQFTYSQSFINRYFGNTWEDRSLLGTIGDGVHPEAAGKFNTEEFDRLVEQGGFINIDQISPNDPRFVHPDDRDRLAAHPDISLGGLLYISDDAATALAFGAGITMAVGAGTFGVIHGVYQSIAHEKLLKNLDQHLCHKLQQIDFSEIAEEKVRKGVANPLSIESKDLETHCHSAIRKDVTWKTLTTGVLSTASVAGGLLGLGMLFPPAFPVLASLAVATLIIGLTATAASTFYNQKRINKAITEALTRDSVQQESALCAKNLTEEISVTRESQPLLAQLLRSQKTRLLLERTTLGLLASTLLLRVSSMAKYTVGVIGRISWIALGAVTTVSTVISSISNYRARQQRLHKLAETAHECILPRLNEKRFWFFGSTQLERYIQRNRETVARTLNKEADTQVSELIAILSSSKNTSDLHSLQLQCIRETLDKKVEKFAKKNGFNYQAALHSNPKMLNIIKSYASEKVAEAAHKDTFHAGLQNTLKIAAVLGGVGFIFPPVTGVLLIAATVTALVGIVVSQIVAVIERNSFQEAMEEAQEEVLVPSDPKDVAAALAYHQTQKLEQFADMLSALLCNSESATSAGASVSLSEIEITEPA